MPTDNIKPSRFQLGLIRRIGVDKYIADVERGKLTTVSAMGSTDEKHKMLERAVWYKGDAHSLE